MTIPLAGWLLVALFAVLALAFFAAAVVGMVRLYRLHRRQP